MPAKDPDHGSHNSTSEICISQEKARSQLPTDVAKTPSPCSLGWEEGRRGPPGPAAARFR
jgi:hypothetical protein